MTLGVVLQRIQPLRVNWDRLLQPGARFVLLHNGHESAEITRPPAGFRAIEVTDYSVDHVAELISAVAGEEGVNCREIKLCTNDEYCLELCGHLREVLEIAGPSRQGVIPFVDKLEMKKRLQGTNIRVPRFAPFEPAAYVRSPDEYAAAVCDAVGLPLVAKPVRGANNRKVELLAGTGELHRWCRLNAGAGPFQLEEHIDGALYHCNALIRDGNAHVVQVGHYLWPCLDFSRGRPIGSITLDRCDELYQRIQRLNDEVLRVLGPPEPCVTHLEVFRTPDDDLVFLEVAARAPGALVPEMCERRTGIHLLEINLRLQMGTAGQLPISVGPYCGWAWFPCQRGIVAQLNEPNLHCECRIRWNARPGTQYVGDADSIICEMLFWHEDVRLVQRDADYLRYWHPTVLEAC